MAVIGAVVLSAAGVTASAAVTYAVGVAVVATVSAVALSAALDDKLKGLNQGGASRGLTNQIDPVGDFDLVYGETRKGGLITYAEVSSDNKYLHRFLILAGHEVDSIGDIYIQDEIVSFASGSEGYVTTGAGGTNWNQKIYIKKFTGSPTQNVYSDLQSLTHKPTDINSTFKGQGIACLYIRMEYDADTFSGGTPLITAKVRGKKVYDPRKDSTSSAYDNSLGVSTHRTNDPTTWQYSDEPALAIRDYLTSDFGVGAEQTSIDDDMIATAVAACATTGASGVEENSFKINGTVTTGGTPQQNLNAFMTTLNGTLFYGQGKWRLLAGAYTSPDASVSGANAFGYDDIISDIGVSTRFSRRDTVNTVRGTFIDGSSDGRYIPTDFPEQQIPSLSEDNGQESVLDLTLPLTTNSATAQRIAKQVLFVGREQISISAAFTLEKAFAVQVGDTIELTLDRYGWTQKQFKVMGWKMSGLDGSNPVVNLNLQETSSTVYQWSVSADEYQAITHNNTSLGDNTAGLAISGLAATTASSLQTDGTTMSRVILSWNAVSNAQLRHYEVQWKPSSLSNYASTIAPNNAIEIEPLTAGTTYNFRVRAITVNENAGAYATINATAVTDTTAPSTPSAPTVTAGVKQLEVSWQGYSFPSDFASMEVHHSTTSSGTYSLIGTSAGTSLVHGGLTQNTTHYYKLKAKDFSGNISAFSAVGNGTVAADVQGPAGPAGQSGLIITLNGADIPMNNQTGEPPTETGVDPRPNNSTTQGKLDEAFLAVNPLLAQMSDIPQDATVWGRFVLTQTSVVGSTTAGQSSFSIFGGHTPDKATRVIYDDEALISGDFQSSPVDSSGNSSSISLTDQFLNRFNLTQVPAGKRIEFFTIQASARSWDYSSQNWTNNADTFDTPVIFSPLVLSKEVLTEALSANEITADQLIINKDVDLLDGAAWRIGKSDYSDITDGIFFGNPSGTGATNYAFAFTATSNSGQSTQHGIEITPQQTKLIQPVITKQATGAVAILDQQTTGSIIVKSGSVNQNAQTVTINAIGGGGGGAGAEGQSGSAGSGGDTVYTLTLTKVGQANTVYSNVTASGGAAGTGYGAAKTDGDAGEASARASGGYGGGAYSVGGTGTLGSGGGGGGGRDYNWTTPSRKGGGGGGAGAHISNSYDISNFDAAIITVTSIGAGGAGMSSSRGNGGAGGTGVLYGTTETSGLDPVFLNTQRTHSVVTSSRTWDTWYLNGDNEAVIQIFVSPNTYRIFTFQINTSASTSGATIIGQSEPTFYTGNDLTVIVPAGQYYSLRRANVNSGDQIKFWGEYK
jgi:hypothetical protein